MDERQQSLASLSSSLNTRTMFFQPPPKQSNWPRQWWLNQSKRTNVTRKQTPTGQSDNHNDKSATEEQPTNRQQDNKPASDTNRIDTNQTVYIQAASSSSSSQEMPSIPNDTIIESESSSTRTAAAAAATNTNDNGQNLMQGYRRGTIIATGSTSPRRGAPPNTRGYQSQQYKSAHPLSRPPASSASSIFNHSNPNQSKHFTTSIFHLVSCNLTSLIVVIIYCININHIVT